MTGFRQKFLKTAFGSPRNKFHLQFFNGSHRVSSFVRQFDQINHRLRFFFLHCWPIIAIKLYSISFFISKILLQQPRAPLKAFLRTFRICTALSSRKWENWRYSIFLGRRHNPCQAHSPQTRSCNKNGGVLELFSRFRRGTENRGFIRIKNFFRRSISNKK